MQMPIPHGMYGGPQDHAPMYVRPPQHFPHQHRPTGHAAMPTVPDVRQPGMARTVNTDARGQTSPLRAQGNHVKNEGSNRQQSCSPHPDNRAKAGHRSRDSGSVNVAANAGQVLPYSVFLNVVLGSRMGVNLISAMNSLCTVATRAVSVQPESSQNSESAQLNKVP